jgi:hypothetical protein
MPDSSKEKKIKKQLGQMLLDAGYIDELQLAVALGKQKEQGAQLGTHLLNLGFIAERNLSEILRKQLGIQWVSLFDREIPQDVIASVPLVIAIKYAVMPIAYDGKIITLAITNPSDLETLDSLAFQLGKKIKPLMALASDIEKSVVKHYRIKEQDLPDSMKKKRRTVQDTHRKPNAAFIPSGENLIDPHASRARKSPVQAESSQHSDPADKKALFHQALINLLIRKNLITKEELFDELMRIEQSATEE